MVESEAEVSVEFVLNVLRQHENDLDRSIAELELLLHKITELTNKLQQIMENSSRSQLT
jgi:prefoldin subunit 5